MKNIKKEFITWISLVGFLLIWLSILVFTKTPLKINFEAIKKIPDAVSIYLVIVVLFKNWMWRWKIFQGWLVPFPDLQGIWEGGLFSTWVNPETKEKLPGIPTKVVIKQTFDKLTCSFFTKESESISLVAEIYEEAESGILRLSYNYVNKPKMMVRDRSEIHYGAAILKIVSSENSLEGEYWTDRKTTGDIKLKFKSKKIKL